jgi:CDP-glucose 4,6-dehydratase
MGRHVNESFWAGRKVLVTGHTGFKGSWLSLWLAHAGARVVGYSDGVPTTPSLYEAAVVDEMLTSVMADVRDRDALRQAFENERPEVVFHLAAQSLVRRSYVEPALTYETNVLGTLNVLEAARAVDDVRVVVVVTTDKVYEHVSSRPYQEDDRLGGADPYSSSKACAELVTAAYRTSLFDDRGPAVATARAGNVIGGGDWAEDRLIPDVIAALTADRELQIRYPQATRPWQHVLNPLDGYPMLAERLWDDRGAAKAWNFGPAPEDSRTVESVAEQVAGLWGAVLRVVTPSEVQRPEAPSLQLDATAARTELGWLPRWELEAGLRATVSWYRRHADGEAARALVTEQIEAYVADRELFATRP